MPEMACRLLMDLPAPDQGWRISICRKCCKADSAAASRPWCWQDGLWHPSSLPFSANFGGARRSNTWTRRKNCVVW